MTAALALLGCFSAWQAWRHNPLYSPRSGLWLLAKIAAMLAVTAAVLTLTAILTAHRSVAVQLGALLVGIVICTLGLVFGISAATAPRVARLQTPLPPSAPVVRLHRRRVTRWVHVAVIYFAICALFALAPDPVGTMAQVLAGIGALLCAITLPAGYVTARRMDRAVTALELHPWLHWQYPTDARAVWCRAQVERLRLKPPTFILRRDWLRLLALCAALVIPGLVLTPGTGFGRLGWGFFCCLLLGLFIELAAAEERRAPARLARRLKAAPPEVWFGHDGMVCDGHFYVWIDSHVHLSSAQIDWRPPRSVCFVFTRRVTGAYGAPVTGTVTQNVLIPAAVGAEELAVLQQQLRSRCPNAEIRLA
ncbi:MAG TPA: hypothetical protein VMF03_13000 [Steroidobacteraceae bacterium]|nr:hypothetical protein [Steroidobacteraceae bacterium]